MDTLVQWMFPDTFSAVLFSILMVLLLVLLAISVTGLVRSIIAGWTAPPAGHASTYRVPAGEGTRAGTPKTLKRNAGECFVCGAAKGEPCDSTAAAFFSVEQLDRYPSWGPDEPVEICPRSKP